MNTTWVVAMAPPYAQEGGGGYTVVQYGNLDISHLRNTKFV